MNQIEIFKQFSDLVIDSSDIESIKRHNPQNVTTNPSIILKAAKEPLYIKLLQDAIEYANKQGGNKINKITNASDKLIVNIGLEILKLIPGHISTELDSRLSFNTEMSIEKARKIIHLYNQHNIDKSRILIKIAATWEGIKAANQLEKEQIHCNLTLVFSFAQARACAESGVYLISPFVGRISDWYKQKKIFISNNIEEDPGIQSIKKIFNYYKEYNYKTIIMGASFRNIEQIIALSGCDKLTVTPSILDKLYSYKGLIKQKLYKTNHIVSNKPDKLSEAEFRWEHNQNAMAVEKLSEGIRDFANDQQKLELLINNQLKY